jgi:hypothetical protein
MSQMNIITLIAPIPQLTIPIRIKTIQERIMFKHYIVEEERTVIRALIQNLIETNEKMNTFLHKHFSLFIEKSFGKDYTEKKYFNLTLYNKPAQTKQQYHCYYNDTGIYDITTVVSVMHEYRTWHTYKH